MKEFKKSDLQNRMVIECRNGNRYMVIDDKILSTDGYNYLDNYKEDLTMELGLSEYDIIKVYDKALCIGFNKNTLELLWERSKIKEVTMSELEKMLGCKVKIVKENKK